MAKVRCRVCGFWGIGKLTYCPNCGIREPGADVSRVRAQVRILDPVLYGAIGALVLMVAGFLGFGPVRQLGSLLSSLTGPILVGCGFTSGLSVLDKIVSFFDPKSNRVPLWGSVGWGLGVAAFTAIAGPYLDPTFRAVPFDFPAELCVAVPGALLGVLASRVAGRYRMARLDERTGDNLNDVEDALFKRHRTLQARRADLDRLQSDVRGEGDGAEWQGSRSLIHQKIGEVYAMNLQCLKAIYRIQIARWQNKLEPLVDPTRECNRETVERAITEIVRIIAEGQADAELMRSSGLEREPELYQLLLEMEQRLDACEELRKAFVRQRVLCAVEATTDEPAIPLELVHRLCGDRKAQLDAAAELQAGSATLADLKAQLAVLDAREELAVTVASVHGSFTPARTEGPAEVVLLRA